MTYKLIDEEVSVKDLENIWSESVTLMTAV